MRRRAINQPAGPGEGSGPDVVGTVAGRCDAGGMVRPEILIATCIPLVHWTHPNLSAPYWRFYWNDRPGARMSFAGQTHEMTPQYCFLIPPGTAFSTALSGHPYHLNCNFLFSDDGATSPVGVYALRLPAQLLAVARRCAAAVAETPQELAFPPVMFASAQARRLTMELSLQALILFGLISLPMEPQRSDTGDARINHLLGVIRRELEAGRGTGLDTAGLSAIVGMHRNSLARLFRRFVGMSPRAYLQRQRVDYASIMLHRQALSIEEIAARLGYCDRYHFSREFARVRGVPPAAFRRNLL